MNEPKTEFEQKQLVALQKERILLVKAYHFFLNKSKRIRQKILILSVANKQAIQNLRGEI